MEKMTNSGLLLLFIIPLSAAFLISPSKRSHFSLHAAPVDLQIQTIETLKGKSAVLTGASSGLGKAMALKLAGCDMKHIVLSGRNVEALEEVKEQCLKEGSACKVHVLPCDLTDIEASKKLGKDSLALCEDQVDMLVLSGGLSSRSAFVDTDIEVDEMLMKVNFLSGAAIAKGIVPSMVEKQTGSIIWISSVQGLIGTPFRTSYAASKFAVQGYCEALRSELSSSGVNVHCISPGYISTNLSLNAATGDGTKHGKMDETTANGADPSDVAVEILDSVVANSKSDFVVAASTSARAAIVLKLFAPRLLEKMLVKRFLTSKEDN